LAVHRKTCIHYILYIKAYKEKNRCGLQTLIGKYKEMI